MNILNKIIINNHSEKNYSHLKRKGKPRHLKSLNLKVNTYSSLVVSLKHIFTEPIIYIYIWLNVNVNVMELNVHEKYSMYHLKD